VRVAWWRGRQLPSRGHLPSEAEAAAVGKGAAAGEGEAVDAAAVAGREDPVVPTEAAGLCL